MKKTYKFLRDILLATISGVYNMALSIIFYKTVKLYLSNHLTIGIDKLNRNRVIFPHPVGIVIVRAAGGHLHRLGSRHSPAAPTRY